MAQQHEQVARQRPAKGAADSLGLALGGGDGLGRRAETPELLAQQGRCANYFAAAGYDNDAA
jgi:hypothetical protein